MEDSAPLWPRSCAPSATFSSTVISGIILTCWKVRETPRRAISREGRPLTVFAAELHRARLLRASTPVIRLKVVDLPAPLGPIRPTICPARIVEADVVHRHQAAELLADGLHFAAPFRR
jgi:hypothetical protein